MPSPANTPRRVTIRMYQMGFGDCFLLSVHYPSRERHILIDFGCQRQPPQAEGRTSWLVKVAENIRERVDPDGDGPGLDVVIATHRHQDHINGFARKVDGTGPGDIIHTLGVRQVFQPWTEHPNADVDAEFAPRDGRRGFRNQLSIMQAMANRFAKQAPRVRGLTPPERRRFQFMGENNISNRSAVESLMALSDDPNYLFEGCGAGLGRRFPGVKMHVLGPPTLRQSEAIRRQTSRHEEFWHFHSNLQSHRDAADRLFPDHETAAYPNHHRWFVKQVEALTGDGLFGVVRALDRTLNNTSLVLLFEIGGKKFLFPGDAQIENWTHALNSGQYDALLRDVDVYKVGHHGSLNATPKNRLWGAFSKRTESEAGERLTTLLSSMHGVHGHHNEVPRRKLVQAMREESDLHTTSSLQEGLFVDVPFDL